MRPSVASATRRSPPTSREWFEAGTVPDVRGLTRELGKVGVVGMHLEGYGCAGLSAVDYGLACLELEAADSGIRSLVAVRGSLAMYAIWRWGSEEHKREWLPRMAAGEAIGCFGLTEPDHGSDPGSMRAGAGTRPATGSSTAARRGSRTLRSPPSLWCGRRPTTASAGSSYPRTWRGSLRPRSSTSSPCGCRSPARSCSTRSGCRPIAGFQLTQAKLNNVREALDICRTARTILAANGISLEVRR